VQPRAIRLVVYHYFRVPCRRIPPEKCSVMAKQLEVIYAQSAELYWLRPNNEIARFVFACCLDDFGYWFAFDVRLLQKL
jgi:hypothetical protein